MLIVETLNDFKNAVFRRNESSQYKAASIWNILKEILPEDVVTKITNEWSNYLTSPDNPSDQFDKVIEEVIYYYKNEKNLV